MSDEMRRAQVDAHYARPRLGESILEALQAMGKTPGELAPHDLAPIDEFHTRGLPATRELAALADIAPGQRVLDLGGGIGGPARVLATEFGAAVDVVDLTAEFCRTGTMITDWFGLGDRVTFRHGSALDIPAPEESYDRVWMQHASMNIEDKERLFREAHRVLRRGGRLALHEILAGARGAPLYPVPWAQEPGISFLQEPEALRQLLTGLGFVPRIWRDTTTEAAAWFRERVEQMPEAPPPLGLHLVIGEGFAVVFRNVATNFEEERIRVVQTVWDRV